MRPPSTTTRRHLTGARLVVVLLQLALLGHGTVLCCRHDDGDRAGGASVHGHHAVAVTPSADTPADGAAIADPMTHGGGLVLTCGILLLGWLALRPRPAGSGRRPIHLPRRRTWPRPVTRRPVAAARTRAPPDLAALSVRRC